MSVNFDDFVWNSLPPTVNFSSLASFRGLFAKLIFFEFLFYFYFYFSTCIHVLQFIEFVVLRAAVRPPSEPCCPAPFHLSYCLSLSYFYGQINDDDELKKN